MAELPAAILARLLGIHIGVAVKWQRASSGDWTNYAADVSRRDNDPTAAPHPRLTPRDMAHDRLKLATTPPSAPT